MAKSEFLQCDFCSSPHITWRYPCKDHRTAVNESIGDWAACDVCSALIDTENWDELARRSVLMANKIPVEDAEQYLPIAKTMHTMFRLNRTDDKVAWRSDG